MSATIRPARRGDLSAVQALVEAGFARYVAEIGRRPAPMDHDYAAALSAGHLYVAEADGKIAAVMVTRDLGSFWEIDVLAVDPARQAQGLGGQLLAFAETRARERPAEALQLHTNAAMRAAQAFYRQYGFVTAERRWHKGYDRIFLRKRLA